MSQLNPTESPGRSKPWLADLLVLVWAFALYLGALSAIEIEMKPFADAAGRVQGDIFSLQVLFSLFCAYKWIEDYPDLRVLRLVKIQYFLFVFAWREALTAFIPRTGFWLGDDVFFCAAIFVGLHFVELPFRLRFDLLCRGSNWKPWEFLRVRFAEISLALIVDLAVCLVVLSMARAHMQFWSELSALTVFAFTLLWCRLDAGILQFWKDDVKFLEKLPDNLGRLLERSGLKNVIVFSYDGSHPFGHSAGFCFSVLGKHTVGLREDLLSESTAPELEYVFAHELGHVAANDLLRELAFDSLMLCFGLGVYAWLVAQGSETGWTYLSDAENLPAFLLTIHLTLFFSIWLQRAFSRSTERDADRYALNLTADAQGMIKHISMRATADEASRDFSEAIVKWLSELSRTHPSDAQRIEAARRWEEERRRVLLKAAA